MRGFLLGHGRGSFGGGVFGGMMKKFAQKSNKNDQASQTQKGNGNVGGQLIEVHVLPPGVSWAMRKVRMTSGRM